MRFGAIIPVLNEWRFMPVVAGQLLKVCDRVVIVRSTLSQSGAPAVLTPVPQLDPKIEILNGTWHSEAETRNAGLDFLSDCDYIFTTDSDEILSTPALNLLKTVCCTKGFRAITSRFYTYWKTPGFRIDPPEMGMPPLVVRKDARFSYLRIIHGEVTLINKFLMHHLSYVRTDDEVKEKLRLFGHAHEIVPNWYENIWQKWDNDPTIENLHPTHPEAYKRIIPVTDKELQGILAEYHVT